LMSYDLNYQKNLAKSHTVSPHCWCLCYSIRTWKYYIK